MRTITPRRSMLGMAGPATGIVSKNVFLVLVAALAFTGCSDRSAWTALERLAEPITFDNALAADQDLEDEYWAIMQDELGIVLSDETRTDRYGTWHPLTLAPDAPVLDIDPGIVPEDLDPAWNAQDVQTAWQAMAEFLVSEQLDSELVWDDTPENRSLMTDRAGQGVLWRQAPESLSSFLDDSRSEAWVGRRLFDQDNGEWREIGGQAVAEYLPARPAPYAPDKPRTLVGSLELDSVAPGDDPGAVKITADVHYCRPISVEGNGGRRYEYRNLAYALTLTQVAGSFDVVEMGVEWSMYDKVQAAALSDETRLRLPLLEPMPSGDDWPPQEVDGLVLNLPPSAVPDPDGSCKGRYPEEDPGETFILGQDPSGHRQCLRVLDWASAADGPVAETVGTNDVIWYVQAPGLHGTVVISTYLDYDPFAAGDVVDFLLTDGPGAGYRVTAEVPAGTGDQFARQSLSTFDVSAVPAPSPT